MMVESVNEQYADKNENITKTSIDNKIKGKLTPPNIKTTDMMD